MYIKTRQQALDALSAVLQIQERRGQIIDVTVKIMLCLDPDPRQLLCDCQAGLIEGDLEDMARKRREMLEAAQTEDLIVIVNPEAERLYESVGRAMDALRLAKVAAEVFPGLAPQFEPWEFARAILANEQGVRDSLLETVRARNTPQAEDTLASGQKKLTAWLEQARPAWRGKLDALRNACATPGAEATDVFHVIAADDERAFKVLELAEKAPDALAKALGQIREILDTIRKLEAESTDTKSRVA